MAVRSNSLIPALIGGLALVLVFVVVSWFRSSNEEDITDRPSSRTTSALSGNEIDDTPVETLTALTGKVNSLTRDFEAVKAERDALKKALQNQANQPIGVTEPGPDMEELQAYVDQQISEANQSASTGPSMQDVMRYVDNKVNRASELSLGRLQGKIGQLESRLNQQNTGKAYPVSNARGVVRSDGRFWVTPTSFVSSSATSQSNRLGSKSLTSITDQTRNLLNSASSISRDGQVNGTSRLSTTSTSGFSSGAVTAAATNPKPVFTIPQNATLMKSKSMTALIGRVPVRGSVRNPIPFKVITGSDNLAANGIYIEGIENAVWSGSAVGDGTLECVRGTVDSVTFVFQDGRIQTVRGRQSGSNDISSGLGWISDARGFGCIPGEFVSNAPRVMRQLFVAGTASGYAQAFSQSQLSNVINNGTLSNVISGSTNDYALGRGLGNGFNEWANYVKERADDLFDAVVIQPGAELVINVTQPIAIDYNPQGRKVAYFDPTTNNGGLD